MIDLKSRTVCFVETGLFSSFCRTVAKEFKKAYYFCPFAKSYPKKKDLAVGSGYPEMERIRYPLLKADEIDLFVFLDLFSADLQIHLASLGHRVWGPRLGEEMELYRWDMREKMEALKMPLAGAEKIIGMEALRKHLESVEDKFIKASFYRGDMESWHHVNYPLSEARLDQLEYDLGPLKHDFEFIVEDSIPEAEEIGYDGYCVDGEFPKYCMQGYEIKEMGMISTAIEYAKASQPVRYVNEKLAPMMKDYGYRGMFCTEIRYADKKPYLIDPCCRLGSPSNELLQRMFSGWGHVFWYGADGVLVDAKPEHKYGVCAMIHCEESEKHWEAIQFPKEIEPWVMIRNGAFVHDRNYAVPMGDPAKIAGVVGVGETLLEAIAKCKEHADQVKPGKMEINLSSIIKGIQTIERGQKSGIHFSDEPLPTRDEISDILDE